MAQFSIYAYNSWFKLSLSDLAAIVLLLLLVSIAFLLALIGLVA